MPPLNFLLLTYSKQIYFLNVFKRFYSEGSASFNHVDLIKNMTGSRESDVIKSLHKHSFLKNMPEQEVCHRLEKLNGYDLRDKNPLEKLSLLKVHPKTLKHRVLIFKELGVPPDKISSQILNKYLTYVKKNIFHLKADKLLDKNVNVMQNLLKLTPLDPSCLDKEFDDSHSAHEIRNYILIKLLVNLLGFNDNISEKWVMFRRMSHKSIVEFLRVLSILQNDLGMSVEKIRNNPFLLSAVDADTALELIATYPVVAGVDIKTVFNNHCKILASPLHNFTKVYQYLKEAEIPDETISKCFEVFTLNCETVRERLEEFKKNNWLSMCWHHPRMMELIIYQKKAKKRIEKLDSVNCKYISVTLLSSAEKLFEKFFEDGSLKYHGKEYLYYLSEELGCDRDLMKSKLMKHPFWNFGSLFIVSSNLNALRSRGFTSQEILDEICILLYPTNMILKEIDMVASRPESDVCRDENGEVHKKFILPLVVYFIERDSKFEGKAIWFWESGTFSPKLESSDDDIPLSVGLTQKSSQTLTHNVDS